MQSNTEREITA